MNSLAELQAAWRDEPSSHQRIYDAFTEATHADPLLKAHRDWIVANDGGCGETAFHHLWKLVIQEMPSEFRFLEIGVYRGQVTSLVGMLAEEMGKDALVVGISPFDGRAMVWPFTGDVKPDGECNDYTRTMDAWIIWVASRYPNRRSDLILYKDDSTDHKAIDFAAFAGPFDVIYIDGLHTIEAVRQDLLHYMPMVNLGGYLLCDDAAVGMNLPAGFFAGFEGASRAVDEVLPPFAVNEDWEYIGSIVHLRIWRRMK